MLPNGFVWKISRMVGSNIQRFAGGQSPQGNKRSLEQCQGHQGNISISQLTGAKVSRISQAYSHVASHGYSSICSELYCKKFFLT